MLGFGPGLFSLVTGTGGSSSPAWIPTTVPGGWWLSSAFGVASSGSTLTGWTARGSFNPAIVVKGTGLTVDGNGDIDFPADAASFVYEGNPAPNADDHTVFGLIRRDRIATGESLYGKFVTATADRAFQMLWQSSDFAPRHSVTADGVNATVLVVGPTGSAGDFHYFVMRKSGTYLDAWWNGVATLNQTTLATIFDTTFPICLGGRSGHASANLVTPFDGAFREFGFYGSALSDSDVTLLLDYLASRM